MNNATFKEALDRAHALRASLREEYPENPDVAAFILLAAASQVWSHAACADLSEAQSRAWIKDQTVMAARTLQKAMDETKVAEELCAIFFVWTTAMLDFLAGGLFNQNDPEAGPEVVH